jgi:iron complex transport system ATP-binding protein
MTATTLQTADTTSTGLVADAVTLAYGEDPVVRSLSLAVPDGRLTALIGPNACGKSTLLRGMARLLRARSGAIYLDGRAIHERPTREVATRLGLLPQSPVVPDGLTVEELVARGRYPHQSWLRQWSADDERAVERALLLTGTASIRGRRLDELSGGQRQRAWIALALAQETPLLLLDEPTTYLDLAHQVEVLDLLHRLNREEGRTIVLVIHDLNLAARYADHLVAMASGEVRAAGTPAEVLTEALMRDVFGLECRVITDPTCGAPLVLPIGRTDSFAAPQIVTHPPEARPSS